MESDFMMMDENEFPGGEQEFYSIKDAEDFLQILCPDLKELTEEDL